MGERASEVMNSQVGMGYESKGISSVDMLLDKKSLETGILTKNNGRKRRKELTITPRASKRLAKVPLDDLELTSAVENCKTTQDLPKSRTSTKKTCDEKLPARNVSMLECERDVENKDNVLDEIAKPLLSGPLVHLFTDPCIAFAIKTLTGGASFDNFETTELSPVAKSCGSLSESTSIVENISKNEEARQINDENQGCSVASPVKALLLTCSSHDKGIDNNEKTDDKPGCTSDMPFMDIWGDPCIEFAIKTLTGTIPIGLDTDKRDYNQQQHALNIAQAQVSSGSNLPDFGLDYFCQTEYLCNQIDSAPHEHTSQSGFYTSKRAGLQK
ncbi:hypothetical protein ACFE04_027304 [Oxalis oulophora]